MAFLSFSFVISWARISNILNVVIGSIFNRNGESIFYMSGDNRHHCLYPDVRGKTDISTLIVMLAIGFPQKTFIK